jgi:hypothetical protein
VLPPITIVAEPLAFTGLGLKTVTDCDAVSVHCPFETITVKLVVVLKLVLMEDVVSPELQVYVPPPAAVSENGVF